MTEEEDDENNLRVLVTGFGVGSWTFLLARRAKANRRKEFQDIKVNPSWEIVSRLPSTINHNGMTIEIITPPEPLKASYHYLFDITPKLLEQHKPNIVLHLGLAVERTYFAIEKGAGRDGYNQYPDVDRKVFNKTETKKAWGKSPPHLYASYDLEKVLEKWRAKVGKVGKDVELRTSDDVGNYVCGFVYYSSLERHWKGNNIPVLFMHVPPLPEKYEVEKGVKVTLGLIQVLAEFENLLKH